MINFWNKLDRELQTIYSNFLTIQQEGREAAPWIHPVLQDERTRLHLILNYSGDLSAIEALGFETSQDEGEGNANGFVDLNKLETIADSADVIQLRYGSEQKYELDDSVLDIRARKSVPGANPFVWEVDRPTGTFSGSMGEKAIVGIIDTGIDFKHKVFFDNDTPKTRILRIWDQGLVPEASEKSPDLNLMAGTKTYGVEYKNDAIDKVNQNDPNAPKIRHRDCAGHGTHVAATAAGDGRQPSFITKQGYEFVGVAPKARIIMVKHLALEKIPTVANDEQRFKDAINYIIEVAKLEKLPVVINCSFGVNLGPHDGLEPQIQFLKAFFENATDVACVFSAGNGGNKRQHARITIPTGGKIEIPFDLIDRKTVRTNKDTCTESSNVAVLPIEVWYKDISPNKIKASLKVPGASSYTVGPDANATPVKGTFDGKKEFSISHSKVVSVPHPATLTPITRNVVRIEVIPEGDNHKSGIYTLKIEGPEGTVLHAWADGSRVHTFGVKDNLTQSQVLSINVTDENTIAETRTLPYVLTVSAFDDATGTIARQSSRGPLVDFSGSGLTAAKPDIAAPGVNITSAWSSKGDSFAPDIIKDLLGLHYITWGGTSMAAPHVAGVVALMLGKSKSQNKSLTRSEIFLKLKARTGMPATDFGKGRLDAQQSFDAV